MKSAAFLCLICFALHVAIVSGADGTVQGCESCSIEAREQQPPQLSSREDAVLAARCHSKCLETYGEALESSARRSNTTWLAISWRSILSDSSTCLNISDMENCRRGCIIRSKQNINRVQCRMECKKECDSYAASVCSNIDSCVGALGFQQCQILCSEQNGCKTGCLRALPPPTSIPEELPATPMSSLILVKDLNHPGLFNLSSYQVPQAQSSAENLQLTSFLIKADTLEGSYYYLQDTINEGMLNLSYLACQAVNISFAAVTSLGSSDFSPSVRLCVHGDIRYPILEPNSINYTVYADEREGFEKNVRIDVVWKEPIDYHLITEYRMQLRGVASCDLNSNIEIPIKFRLNTHTFKAHIEGEIPKKDCKYKFLIDIFPRRSPNTMSIQIDTDHRLYTPNILVECSISADETTGKLMPQITWLLADTMSTQTITNSIGSYTVNIQLVNWNGDSTSTPSAIRGHQHTVPSSMNASSIYFFAGDPEEPSEERNIWFRIEVSALQKESTTFRNLPDREWCYVRPEPHPPSIINSSSASVEEFKLSSTSSGKLTLVMDWNPPSSPFGEIEYYQIRILRQDIRSNETNSGALQVTTTAENEIIMPGMTVVEDNVYVDQNTVCLYAQVRAKNKYKWSSWSDSIPLLLYPTDNPHCEPMPPETTALAPTAVAVATQSKSRSREITAGLGAGFGSAAIILCCIVTLGISICLIKRHKMKIQMKRVFETQNGYETPMYLTGTKSPHDSSSLRMPLSLTYPIPEMDEWEIPVGAVIVESKFGEGCFGEVHRGIVRGPLPSTRAMKSNIIVSVAIKMLKNSATGNERSDFLSEIETMKKVAQGNNPHVITFIGCATLQEPLCLITEFVKYGDLLSYLETIRKLVTHKNRQKRMAKIMADLSKVPEPYLEPRSQDDYEVFPPSEAAAAQIKPEFGKDISGDTVVPTPGSLYAELGGVEPVNLLSFAYQIASGMDYLSSIDIVHRDLACRNILIGEHKTLKISDFGMSRVVTGEDIYVKTSKGRLPWKWMAIESIVNREFTHASDVWAYGVTIWEIATLGGFPYPSTSNADLLDHLKKGYRLECPDNCSPEIYNVMAECWSEFPEDRKTFSELRSLFDAMLAEDSPYIQFENINVHKSYYNVGSRRNTKCEGDEVVPNLSGSETGFESSTSTMTLNGASVNGGGAYDNIIPLLARETPPSDLEEQQGYSLHIENKYVDTPTTFKPLNEEEATAKTEDGPKESCTP